MRSTPFRRALAILLCVQPVFWMSNVALAQALSQPGGLSMPSTGAPAPPAPVAPAEPEVVRAERPVLTPVVPGAPPVDEPLDPDRYVCGPGDVLELNFWGLQNFKLRVTVDLEGRAFVSRVGYFSLQGKTLSEARRMLRTSVAGYFPRLSFDVTLAEPRTFLVQVVDDVVHPASYPARAIDRVATLIAKAGGFGPNASRRRIEIRRRDGTAIQADLALYALTGDVKHNPYVLDGDVVRVPFEDLAASIAGAVNRPGRYELIGTRDLAELVELAGGLAPTVTQLLPISVVRRSPDDRQDQKLFEFAGPGRLPSVPIQHEDSVRMPSFTELQQSVMVIGAIAGATAPVTAPATAAVGGVTTADEVSTTRRLPFVQGDSVRTLLERVGGVGPLADLTGSYILRNGQSVPIDLYSLVMLHDLKADRPIELGDILVVPFKRRTILVEGAVFAPGAYPYHPAYRVEEYLALAGGRNRFAQALSDVRLVTPNGETKEYAPDLKVEPGSSLVVPERNFSRAEVVQIVLGIASVLVSGVAVVLAARK
jgi:protein involved in polysaccharide export with SLBB domain